MTTVAFLLAVQWIQGPAGVKCQQPQVAVAPGIIALTFGAGKDVYFSASRDGGRRFSEPVRAAAGGQLSLGRHRGPRVAIAGGAIVISAVMGAKGGGADGDLLCWRSTDGGRSWQEAVRVNDVPGAAREGLHAMASDGGGLVVAAWLDLRSQGTKLYAAVSRDGGATWSKNRLAYSSPDGHICECCHPSAVVGAGGQIYVMWRNWRGGARDMYLVRSSDGGRTFEGARKLGEGTWPLDACPMDGGGLALDAKGEPVTVWRREDTVYLARPGEAENALGKGKDAALAAGIEGFYAVWRGPSGLVARVPGKPEPLVLSEQGSYASVAGTKEVVAVWEESGRIGVRVLGSR